MVDTLHPDLYTVGWMTVLPTEFAAAQAALDTRHAQPHIEEDRGQYVTGSIGKHNVVIACSGEAGTIPANHRTTQMLRSFPNIKFGLLVGIGGGIPSKKHDIRLGDIVVSKPEDGHGGVAFYDPGKLHDSSFCPTGHLDRPPLVLRDAVTFLEAELLLGNTAAFQNTLNEMRGKLPHFGDADGLRDVLHNEHDPPAIIQRSPHQSSLPEVHHGLIASGSLVAETSGPSRTELLKRIDGDVLCFEMEAAGLMNTFPCMVVRGISNYCDSHKHDEWDHYASGTAACYAKWLLSIITADDINNADMALIKTERLVSAGLDIYDGRKMWSLKKQDDTSYWAELNHRVSD